MKPRPFLPMVLSAALAMTAHGAGSRLLLVEESKHGLLGNPDEFANLRRDDEPAHEAPSFAARLKMLQQHHLAVDGRIPPIYYFFCTVYYVPRESGFTSERGFDTTPDTRLGRKLPKSFVQAVRMEGTGRLANPTRDDRPYISYLGHLRPTSIGNRNNTLTDRKSAAVHRRNRLFRHGTTVHVLDPMVFHSFGSITFETGDTGGGLAPCQIDLYWGEDDPRSPQEPFRPASCRLSTRWIVPVIVGTTR